MTKLEALSILQPKENSYEALKQSYREAVKKYHPDIPGGNLEMMKLVNIAYEVLNACDWTVKETETAAEEAPLTDVIQSALSKIRPLTGIHIELIGTWVWITGDTRAHKEALKEACFRWSPKKTAWYFHEGDYRRKGKEKDLQSIRSKYGSKTIYNTGTYAMTTA